MNKTGRDGKQIVSDLLRKIESRENTGTDDVETRRDTISEGGDDEILELGDSFEFDGFQVVRREFFAHLREPTVSFNDYKFAVNSACLSKFKDTAFVQVMIDRSKKMLALRPCGEDDKDSYSWCLISKGKRKPRPVTCRLFFAMIYAMMGWDFEDKYKILGRMVHANGEYLLVFDLTAYERFVRRYKDGSKAGLSRDPKYPSDWQDQFGMPFREHQESMQISIFDGYAVYAIKGSKQKKDEPTPENVQTPLDAADDEEKE